jgi:hypothetical protein
LEILGPSNIERIEDVAALYWPLLDVCPPYFLLPRWLGRTSEEKRQEPKEIEANLEKYLERWGFWILGLWEEDAQSKAAFIHVSVHLPCNSLRLRISRHVMRMHFQTVYFYPI